MPKADIWSEQVKADVPRFGQPIEPMTFGNMRETRRHDAPLDSESENR
jgi:hypothetical protein